MKIIDYIYYRLCLYFDRLYKENKTTWIHAVYALIWPTWGISFWLLSVFGYIFGKGTLWCNICRWSMLIGEGAVIYIYYMINDEVIRKKYKNSKYNDIIPEWTFVAGAILLTLGGIIFMCYFDAFLYGHEVVWFKHGHILDF